eukprot:GFUD01004330.1.p1 GENE.GFUD01004330.1~~GFUD01004330.1.p1  ORF type:complete len:378 (+),score=125.49 GFUD01004330.1:39-1172(+)
MGYPSVLALQFSKLKNVSKSFRPSQVIIRTFKPDRPPPSIKFSVGGLEKTHPDSSWGAWLTSWPGRQQMATVVGLGGTCGVLTGFWCFKILIMEWMRDEYKEKGPQLSLRARLEGFEEETGRSPQLLKLLSDCQDRSGLDDANFDRVDVFYSCLLDPVLAGSTHTRQGGLVGLPRYMLEDDMNLGEVRVKTNYNKMFKGFKIPENISEEDKQEVERCMAVSTQEKQFLMSLSLTKVSSWSSIMNTAVPALVWAFHYTLAFRVNNKLGLFNKPRYIRCGLQALLACVSLCLYIVYINMSSMEGDTNAMTAVCRTREEVEVALGYYEKVVERNKMLRRLVGEGMEYYIQETGELVPLFYEIESFTSLGSRIEFLTNLIA